MKSGHWCCEVQTTCLRAHEIIGQVLVLGTKSIYTGPTSSSSDHVEDLQMISRQRTSKQKFLNMKTFGDTSSTARISFWIWKKTYEKSGYSWLCGWKPPKKSNNRTGCISAKGKSQSTVIMFWPGFQTWDAPNNHSCPTQVGISILAWNGRYGPACSVFMLLWKVMDRCDLTQKLSEIWVPGKIQNYGGSSK